MIKFVLYKRLFITVEFRSSLTQVDPHIEKHNLNPLDIIVFDTFITVLQLQLNFDFLLWWQLRNH